MNQRTGQRAIAAVGFVPPRLPRVIVLRRCDHALCCALPSFGTMVPPPKRLDSVQVTNNTAAACTVSVLFDNHKESIDLQEDHVIAPGESYLFAEKILDMGSWTAVAPVKKVTVANANGVEHSLEPTVTGVVKQLAIEINSAGQLVQGSPIP